MARAATTPRNFHDSIRDMFTSGSGATSTNSVAYTMETTAKSSEELLDMQKKHNNVALKIMQEQTKLLKKIANDNSASGPGGTGIGDLLKYKMLRKVFGKRMSVLLSFGVEEALLYSLSGIGKSVGRVMQAAIVRPTAKVFSTVAAAGRAIIKPLAGITNALTSSGVMKMVSSVAGSVKFLPKLLGKLMWPITAIMGLVDAFSGWNNAASILGKDSASFGDKVSAAIGTAINGVLLGIPDWIVGKLGGGNVSKLLANGKDYVIRGLKDFGNGVGKLVGYGINTLKNMMPSAGALVGNAVAYVSEKVYGTFDGIKNAIWDGLTYLGSAIKDSLKAVFVDTWDAVKDWWNGDKNSPPTLRPSGVAASASMGSAGASIGAMVGGGGGGGGYTITPGAARASTLPPSLEPLPPTSTGNAASTAGPNVSPTGVSGGTGGTLGMLVAGAESEAAGGYNAYNRGTSGGKILSANQELDLENMTIGELQRRQNLPISDPNRIFAAGKYQMIPSTLNEAVTKYGLDPNAKFDKNMQERLFRDYLVGSKRPAIQNFIRGKGSKSDAIEALSNEFASFGGVDGRGKYGNGNSVSVSPERSGAVLQNMQDTYNAAIAAGKSDSEAYASAFGASSKPSAYTGPSGNGMDIVGNFKNRGVENVNPHLTDILNKAAMDPEIAAKYRVEAYSGYRPGDTRRHGKGQAIDMRLIDRATGRQLENYQNAEDFREYEKFAQKARLIQERDYPDLKDQFRWGGYFSGGKGKYGAVDTMHFDLTSGVGMGGGSWEKGLTPAQRQLFPGVVSEGIAGTQLATVSTATPTTGGMVVVEGGPKPVRGPGMGQLIGNRKSLATPVTGVSGATAYQSSLMGQDVLAGPKSFDDIVKNTSSRAPIDISGRSKSSVPSFDSLISAETRDYTAPIKNPQSVGPANNAGSTASNANGPVGSHSVMDIPPVDEWKMLLGNGSAAIA